MRKYWNKTCYIDEDTGEIIDVKQLKAKGYEYKLKEKEFTSQRVGDVLVINTFRKVRILEKQEKLF